MEAFIPVPLVGFELALLIVVKIQHQLWVFELPGGLRHALLLLFEDRPHRGGFLFRPLGQGDVSPLGEILPPQFQVRQQFLDVPRRGLAELGLDDAIDVRGVRRQ